MTRPVHQRSHHKFRPHHHQDYRLLFPRRSRVRQAHRLLRCPQEQTRPDRHESPLIYRRSLRQTLHPSSLRPNRHPCRAGPQSHRRYVHPQGLPRSQALFQVLHHQHGHLFIPQRTRHLMKVSHHQLLHQCLHRLFLRRISLRTVRQRLRRISHP